MTMLIPCVGGKQIILAQPDVFDALVSTALKSAILNFTISRGQYYIFESCPTPCTSMHFCSLHGVQELALRQFLKLGVSIVLMFRFKRLLCVMSPLPPAL
jgi:hypothetical protein